MIVLDDFKTALDRLKQYKLDRMGSVLSDGVRGEFVDVQQARKRRAERSMPQDSMQPVDSIVLDWSKLSDSHQPSRNSDILDLEAALRTDLFNEEGELSSRHGPS